MYNVLYMYNYIVYSQLLEHNMAFNNASYPSKSFHFQLLSIYSYGSSKHTTKKKKTFVKGMHTSHTSQYGSVKIRLFDARASDVTDTFQPF